MDIAPKNYKLVFEPNLEKFTFDGTAKITIECKKATDTIIMNSAELDIKSCLVYAKKDIPCTITLNEKKEILQIKLDQKIKGLIHIDIKFQGTLNDKLLGFYRSKYMQGAKTKYLATTQFEAADARRAFPCGTSLVQRLHLTLQSLLKTNMTQYQTCQLNPKKEWVVKLHTHLQKHQLCQHIWYI